MAEIRVPNIGDVDEVEVIELCVNPGDVVAVDDAVVVIESDKASMEVPATGAGAITTLKVAVGDMVKEGDLLAEYEPAEGDSPNQESAAENPAPEPVAVEPEPAAPAAAPVGEASEQDVLVPDIGDADDVVVIELSVSVGDQVAEDDTLIVVESDKASMEIPAPFAGEVTALLVAIDDGVRTGQAIAKIKTAAAAPAPVSPEPSTSSAAQAEAVQPTAPAVERAEPVAAPNLVSEGSAKAKVFAGPAVRRLSRELGVDLAAVKGTGARGRITKDDVKAHVKSAMQGGGAGAAPAGSAGGGIPLVPAVDFSKFGPVEVEEMSRIRQSGATNLHRSWLNVVHVTQHDEADVTDLEDFRKSLKAEGEKRGVKVTPLAFIVQAVCHLLKAYPRFNSSLGPDGKSFVLKSYYNIGMAVDTEQGLVVPVIKDADKKGVWELSAEIVKLANKARDGKLGMGDLSGGTFSVSSLGAIGGTGFTPIVNAPEVAILGVAKLAVKPQWNGSEFVPRKMLPLSLSYDHRVINGADAGRFATELCQLLGDIRRLML